MGGSICEQRINKDRYTAKRKRGYNSLSTRIFKKNTQDKKWSATDTEREYKSKGESVYGNCLITTESLQ